MQKQMTDFTDIAYLETGTPRQQEAWQQLTGNGILKLLQGFSPVLTGTIPINIDIESSDLDIICCYENAGLFMDVLIRHFSNYEGFALRETTINYTDSVIANFYLPGFEVEIFGQPTPVQQQNAYRHMLVEYALLQQHGEGFRRAVIDLKHQGMKTEPAFAWLLDLPGDPYQAMLDLYDELVPFG
jgi:hypothetical protein